MRIEKTNNHNVNFNSIYTLKGDLKDLARIKETVIPMLSIVKPQSKIFAMSTDDYFTQPVRKAMTAFAPNTGLGGVEWFTQNIERNHGIKVNIHNRNEIFVFTGEDTDKLRKFFQKSRSFSNTLKNKLHILKDSIIASGNDLTPPAKGAFITNNFVKRHENAFYNFVAPKSKKVDNIPHLIKNICDDGIK